jgi:hypothetical protein
MCANQLSAGFCALSNFNWAQSSSNVPTAVLAPQLRGRNSSKPPSIVDETEAITARLRTQSRSESGRLTIGVHASISAGNLRATLVDHRHRFPDVETQLVNGSSEHLISDVANSAVDVAFVAENYREQDDKSLPVPHGSGAAGFREGHRQPRAGQSPPFEAGAHHAMKSRLANQSRMARSISICSLMTDINGNSRASSSGVGRFC